MKAEVQDFKARKVSNGWILTIKQYTVVGEFDDFIIEESIFNHLEDLTEYLKTLEDK